jgi:hypothetical protein
MTDGRPWWKRKRWWAAGALWLALPTAYLLSAGPIAYCHGRGRLGEVFGNDYAHRLYHGYDWLVLPDPCLETFWHHFHNCARRGYRDRHASD